MAYSGPRPFNKALIALSPEDLAQAHRLLALILGSQGEDPSKLAKNASERAHLAKGFYDDRRARDKVFPAKLFADPAWDILLILYWASHAQQRLSVSSVCFSAAVPQTTALRWIENLHGFGFLHKGKHPTDRRVTWLELSDKAREKLDRYFDGLLGKQAPRSFAPIQEAA